MSVSSLKDARELSRQDSKQRNDESLKRLEQIERDWTMLKRSFKPTEPLAILPEVLEETKEFPSKKKEKRKKSFKQNGSDDIDPNSSRFLRKSPDMMTSITSSQMQLVD